MNRIISDRRVALLMLVLFALFAMSLVSPYFLNVNNLLSLTQYSAVVGLLALGQAAVIIGGGGGIDLSVGSMMSLSSVIFGLLSVHAGLSPWVAAALTLLSGAVLGAVNGVLISGLNLPPLIVTLGTLYLYASLALVLSKGVDINGFDRDQFSMLGQTSIAGIPTQVLLILVPAFVMMNLVLGRTMFGREVYQIGSNPTAARLTGVDVKRTRLKLYVISGSFAALGAIVTASWLLNAKSTGGTGMELQSITIAVLGGVAITGGIGRVSAVFLALILVAILNSGMALAGVGSTYQVGLLGLVLIVSLLVRGRTGARLSVS